MGWWGGDLEDEVNDRLSVAEIIVTALGGVVLAVALGLLLYGC